MGRGGLTDAEWKRLRPFLPVSNRRCGGWRDYRQVIDGILSADGTWERLLQQVQAEADAAGEIDWDISVDSTIVRAHQHAVGARTDPPPPPSSKGDVPAEHQNETPWQSLVARLA